MPKRRPRIKCALQSLGDKGKRKEVGKRKRVLADISNIDSSKRTGKRKRDESLAEYISNSVIEAVKSTLHTKRKSSITEIKVQIPSQGAALELFKEISSHSTTSEKQEVTIIIENEDDIARFLGLSTDTDKRIHPVPFGRGLSSSDGSTYVYAWANLQLLQAIVRNRSMTITVTTTVSECEARPIST